MEYYCCVWEGGKKESLPRCCCCALRWRARARGNKYSSSSKKRTRARLRNCFLFGRRGRGEEGAKTTAAAAGMFWGDGIDRTHRPISPGDHQQWSLPPAAADADSDARARGSAHLSSLLLLLLLLLLLEALPCNRVVLLG